ncbi:MAG: cellulase family glycosylhydrolase [Chloroflexi bacterium]|nr:cellulase family glycosylhydrolase [Chloroflexota bacterium]
MPQIARINTEKENLVDKVLKRAHNARFARGMWALLPLFLLAGCAQPATSPAAPPTVTLAGTLMPLIATGTLDAVRLTTPPASASDQNPAFSPDGSRIVFTRFEKGYNVGPAGLFLLDLNTKQITRLTPWEDQDNVNLPGSAWNATRKRIVFASDRANADDLWRIAPDGSDFGRITSHSGPPWYIEPSWSPDGQWIVFEADAGVPDDQQQGSIWKVRADGSGLTTLTDGPGSGTDDRQPNWSPAGDRILFQRRTPGSDDWNLYTMATDGSDIRPATTAPSSDTDASWSPDGRWIVYSSDYGGLPMPNIFVVPAAGGAPVRVTHHTSSEDGAPSWSPDGRWIAYESHLGQDETTPASLWRIAAPVGTPTPTPAPQAFDKWTLWSGGTKLRGANIYQRRVYPELDGIEFMGSGPVGPPYVQTDLDQLAGWGANYVNISHPGLFTETAPYTVDLSIQNNLDNLLTMTARADMFAVISFRSGPGRAEFSVCCLGDSWFDTSYLNDSVWQDQAAQDAWVEMWRYTAERYRNNPIVAGYDLMVEPNSNEVGSDAVNDLLDIWDPQEFYAKYGGSLYDWNQLYPRIVAAIRQVDAGTPILIGGNGYSAVDWLPYVRPISDTHTLFTIHQYAPMAFTHQEPPLTNTYPGVFDTDDDGVNDQFDRAWIDDWLTTVDTFTATHGIPVAANEFGTMRWETGAAAFMNDEMALFEQRGLNYALWDWEPAWAPWNVEVDAFNFRHGPDPSHHTDVASSDLISVIKKYWARNTIRPSTVTTKR